MEGCDCGHPECHGSHELYILKGRVWNEIARKLNNPEVTAAPFFSNEKHLRGRGHVHPLCARRILGRELEANDFQGNDPLNAPKDLGYEIDPPKKWWKRL